MRAARLLIGLAGLLGMAYAVFGVLTDSGDDLAGHLTFLVAVLVAHDLVVLPVAIGIGWLLVRFVPGWARPPVQSGLLASAVVTVVALPFIIGAGVLPDNPSKFPLDYGRGLLIVLAVIWLTVLILLGASYRRSARPAAVGEEPG